VLSQALSRYFICTEPETLTVTVEVPPSSGMGAIFASALAARALIIIIGRGGTPE
jgi:homoserine kinase